MERPGADTTKLLSLSTLSYIPGDRTYWQSAILIHFTEQLLPVCKPYPLSFRLIQLMRSGALPDWINQDSLVFYDDLSLYPDFGGVVLAETESRRIADYLGSNKAIILQVCLIILLADM
jgi:hypothetical protein